MSLKVENEEEYLILKLNHRCNLVQFRPEVKGISSNCSAVGHKWRWHKTTRIESQSAYFKWKRCGYKWKPGHLLMSSQRDQQCNELRLKSKHRLLEGMPLVARAGPDQMIICDERCQTNSTALFSNIYSPPAPRLRLFSVYEATREANINRHRKRTRRQAEAEAVAPARRRGSLEGNMLSRRSAASRRVGFQIWEAHRVNSDEGVRWSAVWAAAPHKHQQRQKQKHTLKIRGMCDTSTRRTAPLHRSRD